MADSGFANTIEDLNGLVTQAGVYDDGTLTANTSLFQTLVANDEELNPAQRAELQSVVRKALDTYAGIRDKLFAGKGVKKSQILNLLMSVMTAKIRFGLQNDGSAVIEPFEYVIKNNDRRIDEYEILASILESMLSIERANIKAAQKTKLEALIERYESDLLKRRGEDRWMKANGKRVAEIDVILTNVKKYLASGGGGGGAVDPTGADDLVAKDVVVEDVNNDDVENLKAFHKQVTAMSQPDVSPTITNFINAIKAVWTGSLDKIDDLTTDREKRILIRLIKQLEDMLTLRAVGDWAVNNKRDIKLIKKKIEEVRGKVGVVPTSGVKASEQQDQTEADAVNNVALVAIVAADGAAKDVGKGAQSVTPAAQPEGHNLLSLSQSVFGAMLGAVFGVTSTAAPPPPQTKADDSITKVATETPSASIQININTNADRKEALLIGAVAAEENLANDKADVAAKTEAAVAAAAAAEAAEREREAAETKRKEQEANDRAREAVKADRDAKEAEDERLRLEREAVKAEREAKEKKDAAERARQAEEEAQKKASDATAAELVKDREPARKAEEVAAIAAERGEKARTVDEEAAKIRSDAPPAADAKAKADLTPLEELDLQRRFNEKAAKNQHRRVPEETAKLDRIAIDTRADATRAAERVRAAEQRLRESTQVAEDFQRQLVLAQEAADRVRAERKARDEATVVTQVASYARVQVQGLQQVDKEETKRRSEAFRAAVARRRVDTQWPRGSAEEALTLAKYAQRARMWWRTADERRVMIAAQHRDYWMRKLGEWTVEYVMHDTPTLDAIIAQEYSVMNQALERTDPFVPRAVDAVALSHALGFDDMASRMRTTGSQLRHDAVAFAVSVRESAVSGILFDGADAQTRYLATFRIPPSTPDAALTKMVARRVPRDDAERVVDYALRPMVDDREPRVTNAMVHSAWRRVLDHSARANILPAVVDAVFTRNVSLPFNEQNGDVLSAAVATAAGTIVRRLLGITADEVATPVAQPLVVAYTDFDRDYVEPVERAGVPSSVVALEDLESLAPPAVVMHPAQYIMTTQRGVWLHCGVDERTPWAADSNDGGAIVAMDTVRRALFDGDDEREYTFTWHGPHDVRTESAVVVRGAPTWVTSSQFVPPADAHDGAWRCVVEVARVTARRQRYVLASGSTVTADVVLREICVRCSGHFRASENVADVCTWRPRYGDRAVEAIGILERAIDDIVERTNRARRRQQLRTIAAGEEAEDRLREKIDELLDDLRQHSGRVEEEQLGAQIVALQHDAVQWRRKMASVRTDGRKWRTFSEQEQQLRRRISALIARVEHAAVPRVMTDADWRRDTDTGAYVGRHSTWRRRPDTLQEAGLDATWRRDWGVDFRRMRSIYADVDVRTGERQRVQTVYEFAMRSDTPIDAQVAVAANIREYT